MEPRRVVSLFLCIHQLLDTKEETMGTAALLQLKLNVFMEVQLYASSPDYVWQLREYLTKAG